MESNLPAPAGEHGLAEVETPATPLPPRQPLSVAFLPLALAAFIIVAFAIAAWTFLSAGG
jgi:hypothetical protein